MAYFRCMKALQDMYGNKWREKLPKRSPMTLYEVEKSESEIELLKRKQLEKLFESNKSRGNDCVKKVGR